MICPLCNGKEFELIATEMRDGEGRIVECRGCALVMQDLDVNPGGVSKYSAGNGLQTAEEHFREQLNAIQPLFETIRPRLQATWDVLEIGCGTGELLFLVKPLVRSCVGVEMNRSFVEYMRSTLSIETYAGDFLNMDLGRTFDLIIMIDTLDHLPNPIEALSRLKDMLTPEGFFWVTVPNRDGALNFFLPEPNLSAFRKFFWHTAHLFYYTRETIARLFRAVGMNAEISCYQSRTLKDYLSWYFAGRPQASDVEGAMDREFFDGFDPFEIAMHKVFREAEGEFRNIMKSTFRGDTLSCFATKAGRE